MMCHVSCCSLPIVYPPWIILVEKNVPPSSCARGPLTCLYKRRSIGVSKAWPAEENLFTWRKKGSLGPWRGEQWRRITPVIEEPTPSFCFRVKWERCGYDSPLTVRTRVYSMKNYNPVHRFLPSSMCTLTWWRGGAVSAAPVCFCPVAPPVLQDTESLHQRHRVALWVNTKSMQLYVQYILVL